MPDEMTNEELRVMGQLEEQRPLAAARCSASPSALEYCCVQILKGKFWCDVGYDEQEIFKILADKKTDGLQ